MAQTPDVKRMQADADRCVKCGMCLPECPTYRLARDESESPRGRIALIEGLLGGRLTADRRLIGHLDHCLTCRRCESVCPSQVPYARLLDDARALLPQRRGTTFSTLLQHPRWMRLAVRAASLVPSRLSRPLGGLHRAHSAVDAVAPRPAPRPGDYPTRATRIGRVGLFAGCTGQALQGGALQAAIALLNHTGFDVHLPARAACCGALAQHGGQRTRARAQADATRALYGADLDAVVSIASGCGTHIDGYAPPLQIPHLDVCRFLLERADLGDTDFVPLAQTVFLHVPCTVENVYRGGEWARTLLHKIPQIQLLTVGESGQCCGAAGEHMLRHPGTAASLREPVLAGIQGATGDLLLTSNIGCAMHLGEGLIGARRRMRILHPVELLAGQLRDRDSAA